MSSHIFRVAAVAVAVLAVPTLSRGEILSYQFSGTTFDADARGPFRVGDPFSGTMTFDTSTSPDGPPVPDGLGYEYQTYSSTAITVNAVQFTVDGVTFTAVPADLLLTVQDDPNGNFFDIGTSSVQLELYSIAGTESGIGMPFTNTALPTSLNLADFGLALVTYFAVDSSPLELGNGNFYYGTITSLTLVPEPSTLALLTLGAIGLLTVRRERRE